MWQDLDMERLIEIAKAGGKEVLAVYETDFNVENKDDKSPLTEADRRANAVILKGLQETWPDVPFISEETKALPYNERKAWSEFWLIDPLDGTKEFIKRNGEFTINIALVSNGEPVAGVVFIPVQNKTFWALKGKGSFMRDEDGNDTHLKIDKHYSDKDSIKVVASRSHLSQEVVDFVDDLKSKGKEVDFLSAGSSLKFCLVAEGKADVYPRFGPTMEWDTGAAHAVALEAGLKVLNAETKQPLTYNKENLLNPWFIVE